MPYATATSIPTHIPSRDYPYYVFVSESVEIERNYQDQYDDRDVMFQLFSSVKPGIYGFTNKDNRDSFISLLNRSSENEVAFIAVV